MDTIDLNPILNNPYSPPNKYYQTDLEGNLSYAKIIEGRRPFDPQLQAMPTKQSRQGFLFGTEAFAESYHTHIINLLRAEVSIWRENGYKDSTRVSKELLNFWFNNSERLVTKQLFFAQREAIETAIWLNEIAAKSNVGSSIITRLNEARQVSQDATLNLPRTAFKMATGTGKTVVMAALILYHFLNRREYRNDTRFADYFLVVTPGVTIKERLNVLYVDTIAKNSRTATDYYTQRGLVPPKYEDIISELNAKLSITNYHNFEARNLQGNKRSPFDGKLGEDGKKVEAKENVGQTLKRTVGKFKIGGRLLILNDEAHHCYLPLAKGSKTEEEDSEEENQRAAVWYRGLVEIARRFKVSNVYDLSATPYFLNGSGYAPYSLFQWTVTDFGLTEAIESGLVKIPFIPENDNTHGLTMPVLRDLYKHIREFLPKKRKPATSKTDEQRPNLPTQLRLALEQFFAHYKKDYESVSDLYGIPPVFIVVCNNTAVSKEVYKYLAGYEILNEQSEVTDIVTGKYELFSNFDELTKAPKRKPPTLLIDSDALENSNQINEDFKRIFAPEIARFKQEYRNTHPEKSIEDITDATILREVVNTVGRPATLGQHIRCVVSVSMLTEGWDANTVTHIVGIRAFGSQLLCEQVAGRALRRKNYLLQAYDLKGRPIDNKDIYRYKPENVVYKFPPEYAHIIGVPFAMFKAGKSQPLPKPIKPKHVHTVAERAKQYEIQFPNVIGYRIETQKDDITADFERLEEYQIDATKISLETQMGTAFSSETQKIEVSIEGVREQEVVYHFTKELIKLKYSDDDNRPYFEKFNQLKNIVAQWYATKVRLVGHTNPEYKKIILYDNAQKVCEHIYRAIELSRRDNENILPVFNHYNKIGDTNNVNAFSTREVYATRKSAINFVVADTESWEQLAAKSFDEMDEVQAYAKNAFLGFKVPYLKKGSNETHHYEPDFILKAQTPSGRVINLIVEISGMSQDKDDKKFYLENRWLPAVNSVREKYSYDEWHFVEIGLGKDNIKNIKFEVLEKLKNIA
ncbi:BPTD_3080 family restriction endonuclease [Runella zeae]|uniref:BPTD_3080 family restriction endonuclease n=1 Tax=Runella zeae TaxID=94255 RepID=UPI00055A3752